MPREAGLLQALTATDRLSDLLPVLHHHAVSAVQGRSSILFEFNRTGDALRATSAFGVDQLPQVPWAVRQVPKALFHDGRPLFAVDLPKVVRGVSECLETTSGVLVPLAQAEDSLGILVVGAAIPPSPDQLLAVASVGHAFAIALERTRVAAESDRQLQLGNLLQEFGRSASSTNLSAGLEALCLGTNRLFGADRTSVWLHDRRARMVVLSASSDVAYLAQDLRISTADALAAAAIGLRRDRAEIAVSTIAEGARTGILTIPLKGKRRALGTMVIEAIRLESGSEVDLLDRADEVGRQLSAAIENVLLLDAVLRSRRELEYTLDALSDLVAVFDQDGRLGYMNRPFLERTGKQRRDLIDHSLEQIMGPATRKLIERATPLSADVDDPLLGGTFHVTLSRLIGEAGEPRGVVFVARDITPHAQPEAERPRQKK